jgi:2-polyprenyl-6-methoxyphenol hydroxylase-like FAD-dependent oxidoreductase
VLVVGKTIVALTLTALLRRAGYEPLLAAGTTKSDASRLAYLWPSALRILETAGVAGAVADRGVEIDTVSVLKGETRGRTELSAAGGGRPTVISTASLRRILEARVSPRRTDRSIDTLTEQDNGLVVEFENGVREWFDVVVRTDAGGETKHHRASPEVVPARQYERAVETPTRADNRLRETWHPAGLVQRLPRPGKPGSVLRVTTPASERQPPRPERDCDRTGSDGHPGLGRELSGIRPTSVRQTVTPLRNASRAWWGENRVASCGQAACTVVPASGFGPSLGIEDASVFVSTLTDDGGSMAEVVETYATDRTRRVETLHRQATRTERVHPTPDSLRPPLDGLSRLRRVALLPFFGDDR